jgi:hypothetical protein
MDRVPGGDGTERLLAAGVEDIKAFGDLPGLPRLVPRVVAVDVRRAAAVIDDVEARAAPVRGPLVGAAAMIGSRCGAAGRHPGSPDTKQMTRDRVRGAEHG